MKITTLLGAAALLGLGFVGDAAASSHSEAPGTSNRAAPSMEPFGTFWLHVGGGVAMTRNTTFRDQDCNSPNSFFGCDFNAPGDFGDSGAVINLGVGTPLGGPFRGAIEVFHGNNLQFEGPLVDNSAFSTLNAAGPGITEIFHADAQFTKVEFWVYVDINKVFELPRYVQPFLGGGVGVTRNRLSNVHSKVESGSFNLRADLPGGTETNFTWGATAGFSIPLDGPNGPVIDIFFLHQDLGRVSTRGGDATIQFNSPFGSSSETFPVDPVRADLAVDVFGARARFPLNTLFGGSPR